MSSTNRFRRNSRVILIFVALSVLYAYGVLIFARASRSLKDHCHDGAALVNVTGAAQVNVTEMLQLSNATREGKHTLAPSESSDDGVYRTLSSAFAKVQLDKVKDIKITGYPEAFFLSILPLNGILHASYRTTLSSWETKVVQLNEHFEVMNHTATRIPNTEDARVIELNGEGWLIDNHFMQPRAMTTIDGRRRVMLNTSGLGPDFDRGKNWSPFVYKSRLFFVYSLSPLRVLECDMPSGVLRWAYGVQKRPNEPGNPKNLGLMMKRGGTNAVVYGDYIYGVGRETNYVNVVCSGVRHQGVPQHFPFLWRFRKSLIDSPSPSHIESIESSQLVHPFDIGVNDPASLFVRDSALYLTVSSCDCNCLPGFVNTWQHNSVFKLKLSE